MKGELIINGIDAYLKWGVEMGESFISNLTAPVPMKDVVESKSRLKHGKEVVVVARKDERDLTLTVTLAGKTKADFLEKKKSFFSELYSQKVNIRVPSEGDEIYRLLYTGKSITYNQTLDGCFAKIAVKFNEPNPDDRGDSAQD